MANVSTFRSRVAAFEQTFTGKLFLSALRAFIGVFIAAEADVFTAVIQLVNSHSQADFNVLKSVLVALVAAGITAAIRAVQHFLFESPKTA